MIQLPLHLVITMLAMTTMLQMNLCKVIELINVFSEDSVNNDEMSQPLLSSRLPDLSNITNTISKNDFFNDQNPVCLNAVAQLKSILLGTNTKTLARNKTDFIEMIGFLRNVPDLHPSIINRAVVSAIISRPDRADFHIPSLIELEPDLLLTNDIIRQLQAQSLLPDLERSCVLVDGSRGVDNGIENRLWYFREDVMINSHHWFWHLTYPFITGVGDRRGELFYSLHQSIIARYYSERLSNSLPPITPFTLEKGGHVPDPYYSHLTQLNSKQNWANRPPNQPIPDTIETKIIKITIDKVITYRQRILTSIDNGKLLLPNGSFLDIRNVHGIDAIGNILEASKASVNPGYYDNSLGYHNYGHIFLSRIMHPIDPTGKIPAGVMSETASSMRDVIFYRWHTSINHIFRRHKNTLAPYQPTGGELPLNWPGIFINQMYIKSLTRPNSPINSLHTFWSHTKYNLINGLDFKRNETLGQGPAVQVCVKHLNHDEFQYNIKIRNRNGPTRATIRIFLAPRYNIDGIRHTMLEQHELFFALDTFRVTLHTGDNTIRRNSIDSTLTISSHQAFDELNNDQARARVYCGCGWPHHMLLPKGKSKCVSGMVYDLFVMATKDGNSSIPQLLSPSDSTEENKCQEPYLYCGSHNKKYPDSRPMGYPFDRLPYSVTDRNSRRMVRDLDEYKKFSTNMASVKIKLYHLD